VVVSFDALRADALGAYGYPKATSPRIDEFAGRSLVFDRAYSVAPVTPTSFAAAFTGQLPHRVFRGWKLEPVQTISQIFSEQGYRTAAFMNNAQVTTERNFDRGFHHFTYDAADDPEVLSSALAWLSENGDGKFFLWMHFLSPHAPYSVRDMASHLYDPEYQGQFQETTKGKFETDEPAEIERIRSLYDGEVFWADHLFGELLDQLEATGVLGRSLLVLTADHGEEFKERGGFQHKFLNEETIRIPLIIHHPKVSKGRRTDMLARNLDLLPTLAATLALPELEGLDGRNLMKVDDSADLVISEAMTDPAYRGVALIEGDRKLILTCYPEHRLELYDLVADPGEGHDLAEVEHDDVDRLRKRLLDTFGAAPCDEIHTAMRRHPATRDLSRETIEKLRAIGYVD